MLYFNTLTPNDLYISRTAPLTSKRCILYIYSTNVGTEYFKHALYSPFFVFSKCSLLHNANFFGSCNIHILYTGCAEIKKNNSGAKGLRRLVCIVVSCLVCIVVLVLCVLLSSYVYLYYVCIAVFTLDVGLLARRQYSEGPATGHLDTRFSWFPCVCKQMLRWFPRFQVATTCFSRSPPDLNLVVTNFIFCIHVK